MNKRDLGKEFSSKVFKRLQKLRGELYYLEQEDLDYISDYVLALESLVEDGEI